MDDRRDVSSAVLDSVGFVGSWFEPDDRLVWSGVPVGLRRGLHELGYAGDHYDATPPRWAMGVANRIARRRGASEGLWALSPEMRFVTATSNLVHRWRSRGRADAWVNPASAFGRPVAGRVAALFELSPEQLRWMNEHQPNTTWPPLSARGVDVLCRQQERLLADASVVCTASGWARDSLIEDHGVDADRVHVVGYGRNLELEPPPEKDWTTPRFLFVGRDWDRKNGDVVVRAFRRLRVEVPSARLDVEGLHPPLDEPGITGHGRLDLDRPADRQRLESLFREATCFVMPSRVEAFGIVYVEAAGAGVPSIGTTVGGTADSVGDGGRLVDPDDDDALLDAMRDLARPATAQRLGAAALARADRYTWRSVARRVVAALAGRPEPGAP